ALAVAAKHPIAWSAAMAPRWQQELREAVPILGLTPELVGWVLDEWGRQQAAGRERGTWDRDLAKGVVPALRGIWWARRRERAWLEAQLARRAAQLAPEAQADTPEDLGELRYSEDLAAVRLRLLGGGGVA
ncbi:MAG: hypothetical protein KC457_22970, partial [Myxococcales bacterium]|nr:hypothetical protein [Myxococcales bacterium]